MGRLIEYEIIIKDYARSIEETISYVNSLKYLARQEFWQAAKFMKVSYQQQSNTFITSQVSLSDMEKNLLTLRPSIIRIIEEGNRDQDIFRELDQDHYFIAKTKPLSQPKGKAKAKSKKTKSLN